ncbi:MAG: hypothetical protein ACI9XC_000277 [Gammaproteobacteria bacterium]|jgi:hypothetical protein
MALIAPLFLLGLVSIALPIWLHRMNTQSPKRERFSSAMFLEESTQQTYIRKQLQYILLLALRILFLIIMVLAFAKPLITKPPVIVGGEDSVLHMIVVDTSFSMKYGDWLNIASDTARQIVSELEDEDLAQIFSASNGVEILNNPTNNQDVLRATISMLTSGYGRLDMGVLIANLDRIVAEYGNAVTIHLISDFQESGLPSKFADLIPDSLNNNLTGVEIYTVAGNDISNLYIESVDRINAGLDVRVRSNITNPVETTVRLQINGELHEQKMETISESGLALFQFTPAEYEPGENRLEVSILNDEPLIEDNNRYVVIDNTPPRPVLLLTTNIESLSVKYLSAAVETSQLGFRVEAVAVSDLDPRVLQRYPWLIIDDLGIVNETLAPVITEYLNTGGAVFAALGDRSVTLDSIPVIDLMVKTALLSSDISKPNTVARIDLSHPALAQTSGWRDINISRYLNLEAGENTQTLVSLEDGSPLVLERKFDRGRMILLSSSLDNQQNDIPIRPVFVNFIAEAGRYLSGEHQLQQHQIAGDYLQLLQTGSATGQVIDPEGRNLFSLAETHRSQDIKLNQTGFYEIYAADSENLVAVNADLRESDMSIISEQAISAWRDAMAEPNQTSATAGPVNIAQDSIEIWHILLVIMGIVVLAESMLGNKYIGSGRGYK